MSCPAIALLSGLARHPRGKNLGVSFKAEPAEAPPEAGAVMVFGKDYQTDSRQAVAWSDWANGPGRLLVLVPPFAAGICRIPTTWEVRRMDPLTGGESALSRILAAERVHEIRGSLMPLERVGGAVITAGWRKHSAAGFVVWTANPLWSLTLLDHPAECATWMEDLYSQCGATARVKSGRDDDTKKDLSEGEWTMLLHLCTGSYASEMEALAALKNSQLLHLDEETAREALRQLETRNLVVEGRMTDAAEALLAASRYDSFARELRRLANG